MENESALANIPIVDIDEEGVFKYVLLKVWSKESKGASAVLVRGFKWGVFHRHIFQDMEAKLRALGLEALCLGGGRISKDSTLKKINVYGFSTNYGKADHELTTRLLKEVFTDYEITWSNEGY